jgi:hypothetical protein
MSEVPFELQKLVTVATYNFPWEAQVAKARLIAFGVPALIAGEHTIRLVALTYAFGGIHVQVCEADEARAREVLAQLAPLPDIYLVRPGEEADAEPSAPPSDEEDEELRSDLVTVARFHTTWEAHLARTLLESEGIDACVFEDRVPLVNLLSGLATAHNRLEVREADAERAGALLAERIAQPEDDEEAAD